MHDEFISAYRGVLDLVHSKEVPQGYCVRRFCDALQNGYVDILINELDVKEHVTKRATLKIRAPNAEVAEELAAAIDRKAHASDTDLAEELRADDAELRAFDDAEEDEGVRDSATAAAHRLAARAPKIDEAAVEKDGKSSFGKVVDAADTAGKLHKGADAVGTSWKWLDYLTSLFG